MLLTSAKSLRATLATATWLCLAASLTAQCTSQCLPAAAPLALFSQWCSCRAVTSLPAATSAPSAESLPSSLEGTNWLPLGSGGNRDASAGGAGFLVGVRLALIAS